MSQARPGRTRRREREQRGRRSVPRRTRRSVRRVHSQDGPGRHGVRKRTLRSGRRVHSQDGPGRGLRRSSQADQKKRHRSDGDYSVRLLKRKGGKWRCPRQRAVIVLIGRVGVHKRMLHSVRRVHSQNGPGRGLRRSFRADQREWQANDGCDSRRGSN